MIIRNVIITMIDKKERVGSMVSNDKVKQRRRGKVAMKRPISPMKTSFKTFRHLG